MDKVKTQVIELAQTTTNTKFDEVNIAESTLGEQTTITMKFLPYFAKLKTDTAVAGQCDVNMCISIILEKTSS